MGFGDEWLGLIGGVKVNVEGSKSYQTTNAQQYQYSPTTTDARSVAISIGSGSASSTSSPYVQPSNAMTQTPSQSATQQSPETDKMATYVLIGGAIAVAFIIFSGKRKK